MRWQGGRRSSNIEDRRGMGGAAVGGLGCGGVILVVIVSLCLGLDPLAVLSQIEQSAPPPSVTTAEQAGRPDDASEFVSVVLASTEDVWGRLLDGRYRAPRLVLFTDAVHSACGTNSSAVGPFYCPGDEQVYLDLTFFAQLSRELGAPGDFAQAYVIAHEVGHHIQTLTGTSEQVARLQQRNPRQQNELSVLLELQADCYAGVWAHHARHLLETGDVEEGLRAAGAIGDDVLQRRSQGYSVPESFTHGSAGQRIEWLRRGITQGNPAACDTFSEAASVSSRRAY